MTNEQHVGVAGLFDRVADTYDAVGVEMFGPVARRLVAELDPRPGERTLDVGCGRGAVLFPLAEAVGGGGSATGLDLSARMVESTRADAVANGVGVEVVIGDAQSPDFEPESFDVVASSLVLFFLSDPGAALLAWHRLLADGGRLGVSTFGDYSDQWRSVDAVFEPFQAPKTLDPRTQPASSPFASDEGMEALVADAGFVEVRTATMSLPVRFVDRDQWYRWTWSTGQRWMWEAVPEDQRADVRALAYEQLDACRDADGRIGFDQDIRFTLARR